jgi:hypothetical protein
VDEGSLITQQLTFREALVNYDLLIFKFLIAIKELNVALVAPIQARPSATVGLAQGGQLR